MRECEGIGDQHCCNCVAPFQSTWDESIKLYWELCITTLKQTSICPTSEVEVTVEWEVALTTGIRERKRLVSGLCIVMPTTKGKLHVHFYELRLFL